MSASANMENMWIFRAQDPDLNGFNLCTITSAKTWSEEAMADIGIVLGRSDWQLRTSISILQRRLLRCLEWQGFKAGIKSYRKLARLPSLEFDLPEDDQYQRGHITEESYSSWLNSTSHLQLIEIQKQVMGRLEKRIKELQEFIQQGAPGDSSDSENLGGSVDSKLDDQGASSGPAHTTIKPPANRFEVLQIPANGTSPRIISLPTINVELEEGDDSSLSHLPDLRPFWGKEGWSRRQYFRITFTDPELADEDINDFYYIFIFDDERSLLPNPHFAAGVCGDVYIMRQANYSIDEERLTAFADISENVLKMKHWRVMFKHAIEAREVV
ncbi:hypothetical protein BKA64DRAFT_59937 [Cadophora sp. MPI-SDFR-AT-0126]|nr:hypothetical protein BKA64DRAFT_59937 [Leotiomycetes sp. MPI-SDFR-AT-0126]